MKEFAVVLTMAFGFFLLNALIEWAATWIPISASVFLLAAAVAAGLFTEHRKGGDRH